MSGDEFKRRMDAAINRGRRRASAKASAAEAAKMSEEERKRLHTQYRLELSDLIEKSIKQVADHFPGFRVEGIFGQAGWGTACYRDDLAIQDGRRENRYSRLEMVIRPYSDLGVLDLKAKGTVGNREIFNRANYEAIDEADPAEFRELIETWAIEYAEMYAANR
ncbi:MAG: hypothetical protein AAF958_20125 [Planctomycetota bacterium]